MHALVIEDYAVLAMQIADELTDLGFATVSCAATCAEAITLAFQECPDLITADSRMGAESGFEAVRTICARLPIPVVYIVGTPEDVRVEVPDAIILEKPFTIVALGDAVRLAMSTVRPPTGIHDHLPSVDPLPSHQEQK